MMLYAVNSFTVSWHSLPLGLCKRTVIGRKTVEIPTKHVTPEGIATEAFANYNQIIQSQKGDATNKWVSQMWAPLAAHLEPVGDQNRQPKMLYVFEHKT